MTDRANTVLLVDPDPRARAQLAEYLKPIGCRVIEAADGVTALRLLHDGNVRLVVTELYLPVTDDECLIQAIRRDDANRTTRIVALTHRCLAADREWAMRAGADAYLIKPTRAQRVRYVVGRLTTARGPNATVPAASTGSIVRRDSLDAALSEIEHGTLTSTCIIFSRIWWEELASSQRTAYRRRAKSARVSLRSDSMLKTHFVEVRGRLRGDVGLSTERPESPYRR
jgi:two-component system chemotaxis response regulator CheY